MEPTLKEIKMGLNTRDIQLYLLKVLHVSFETSYNFMRRHPFISGALLVFFILYIFLSFIYNLLVFLSPFFVCIAIFVRIFWSSEQKLLRNVNNEEKQEAEKKVEQKITPEMLKYERRALLYKCPSHNATSRRRNFTGKKWDVYGGLEIKAKDLSSVFRNEFTINNKELRKTKFYSEKIDLLEAPIIEQTLSPEPSMLDLSTSGVSCDHLEKKMEIKKDEKKTQDNGDKSAELTEDEKKNEMDLGPCELERHKRLESLMARRRAKKQLKLQIEKGLIDMKSVIPSQIAPLFVTRLNPFDSPKGFDGIEMPGSAPSTLRSPFDIPYEPFEEKPILTGDSFDKELKDLLIEPKQENLDARGHKLAHLRVTRLQEASESESKASIASSEAEETTDQKNDKCEIDKMVDITGEEADNAQSTKSMSNNANKSDSILVKNVEKAEVPEKLGEPIVSKPQDGNLNLPISSDSATKINDSLYESLSSPAPVNTNQETISFTGGPINHTHTPTYSLASDLQVEVSEVGSPTLTVDDNHETTTTTDGESIIYDGDIDKDVTSGSEDMWGASLHLREVRRVSEQDISEINSWRDISSPLSLLNIDEENAADVSSMSSRSDMPDDTPTYTMSSDHNNIFGNMKDFMTEKDAPQPSHSSVVSTRWKRLMRLMDTRVNHLPHGRHSGKPRQLFNLPENSSKAQVINYGNNKTVSEQDNMHNSRDREEPSASDSVMQQEVTDEVSPNSSSSSSPRSVLSITQKTTTDQVPSSTYNQETHLDVQSNKQDVAQEMLNVEASLDSIPQYIQLSMDDPNFESHNNYSTYPQEQTCPSQNSIQESNISSKIIDSEVCNKEHDNKLNNNENSKDKFTPPIRQDSFAQHPRQIKVMASEDINEESREAFDEKVLISLILESSLESPGEDEEKSEASVRQEATTESSINVETTDTSSDDDFERKYSVLNKNEAIFSSRLLVGDNYKFTKTNKPNDSLKVNYLQSESKQVVKDHMEKKKLDKGDIYKDSPLPSSIEVVNTGDTEGERENINKNEANEVTNIDNTVREHENINKNEVTEVTNIKDTEGEHGNINRNEATEVTNTKDMEGEHGNINKNEVTEVTNTKDTEGEHENINNTEDIEGEHGNINKNEVTEVTNTEDTEGEHQNINKSEAIKVNNIEDIEGGHGNINKNEVIEVTNTEATEGELIIINKNEATEVTNIEGIEEEHGNINKNEVNEVTNIKDTEGEHGNINRNATEVTNTKDMEGEYGNINENKVTEVTNTEDIEGEHKNINKNEAIKITNIKDIEGEHINKNEAIEATNTEDTKRELRIINKSEATEVTNIEGIEEEHGNVNKNEVTKVTNIKDTEGEHGNINRNEAIEGTSTKDMEGEHGNINKNKVTEVTNTKDTEGEHGNINKNEITGVTNDKDTIGECENINKNETNEVTNTKDTIGECGNINKNETNEVTNTKDTKGERGNINKNEVAKVTNIEDTQGKHENINNNEATEITITKDTEGECGNINKNEVTEVTNIEDTEGEHGNINKNEVINQDWNKNDTMVVCERGNINKNEVTEVINIEDTEGEHGNINKNEVIDQDWNKNDTMVCKVILRKDIQEATHLRLEGTEKCANEGNTILSYEELERIEGFVISDWEGIDELCQPYGSDYRYCISTAINDGIDTLVSLVQSGEIPIARIDDAVERILSVKFAAKLFEFPLTDRDLALEAVQKSLVLLKNGKDPSKPFLPLNKNAKTVLVSGTHADNIGKLWGMKEKFFYELCSSKDFTEHNDVSFSIIVVEEGPYAECGGDNSEHCLLENKDALAAVCLPGTERHGIPDVIFGDQDFKEVNFQSLGLEKLNNLINQLELVLVKPYSFFDMA
ncbi:hypothetical protein VNO78_31230 [Psophocarpus tetragonolobus]|uniref:Uncharacterized protein n=1 Tax=Psophocarpus tetragonolobus TaxID=3891 RepID=A0AAN9RY34_PSOTE